jgi:hypothetical protein
MHAPEGTAGFILVILIFLWELHYYQIAPADLQAVVVQHPRLLMLLLDRKFEAILYKIKLT